MLILSAIINGILYGGVLAVLAYGMNLMFGVVQIIHLAYGQSVMVGLYLVYVLTVLLHLPLIASCLIAVIAIALLGLLTHLSIIQPLLRAPLINQLLALAGLMVILENACLVIFGATYKAVPIHLPVLHIGELYLATTNLTAFFGGLATLGLLYLFLNKTYIGLGIKATAQDAEAASLMGINPRLIYFVVLAAGGALAGIAAACFVPIYAVHPHFGGTFTLIAFVIVVLGGMGNLLGGLIGAFIIGVVTSVGSVLFNPEAGEILALLMFILIILIRPQGILGVRARA